jgi:hypothetical protein
MFGLQPLTPVIIKVVSEPTPQVSVVDVIVDSLGLVGLIGIGSLAVGGVLGVLLISITRWRETRAGGSVPSDHTPLNLSAPMK